MKCLLALPLLLLLGCAHAPTTTPLRRELAGRRFPSPLVEAEVAGHKTLLIVDTGATYHVLAAWFAKEAGLDRTGRTVEAMDHAGRPVATRIVEGVTIRTAGATLLEGSAVGLVEMPDVFRALGIGGILSPQHLAKVGEAVVLDLGASTLRVLPRAAAERRLDGAARDLGRMAACNVPDVLPYRRFIVDAKVADEPVRLTLDTGTGHTALGLTSALATKLAARAAHAEGRSFTIGGEMKDAQVPDVAMRVGALEHRGTLALEPAAVRPECPMDGVLGMDLLADCVLVLEHDAAFARCGAPPARSATAR